MTVGRRGLGKPGFRRPHSTYRRGEGRGQNRPRESIEKTGSEESSDRAGTRRTLRAVVC